MKTIMKRLISVLSVSALVLFLAVSCRNGASDSGASLCIRIQDDTQRTIMPNAALMSTQKYSISGSGPAGATFGPLIFGESSISINDIAVGSWTITAKALNAENNELASGTTTMQIRKGRNEGTIVLDTVPGYGNLQLDFKWQSNITAKPTFTIVVSLEDAKGNVVTKSITAKTSDLEGSVITNIAAGSHVLTVKAMESDGTSISGVTEAVRIVANTWVSGTLHLKAMGDSTSDGSTESSSSLALSLENRVGAPMNCYIDYYPKNPTVGQVMTLKACISEIPSGVDSTKLRYQWYKDGVLQRDGVGMNYIIVTESGSHRYDVVVKSNLEGSVCSASVMLNM